MYQLEYLDLEENKEYENISKAKQDFNKVLSGGNLANTFDKNKKDKER